MEKNKRISDLFERARTEVPKTSFNEVKGHFLATSAVAGTGLLAKWAAASFKFKVIVMISALSTLTISGIIIATQFTSNPVSVETKREKSLQNQVEIIEVRTEDGVEKTIVYNEKNEVLNIEVDSSEKTKDQAENFQLKPLEPSVLNHSLIHEKVPISVDRPKVHSASASDSLVMKNFKIDERTTEEEIKNIQQQAIDAGLEFTFHTIIRQSKIKRLRLNIKKGSNKWALKITKTDSFSFTLGWWEDDAGQFVRFIRNNDLKMKCGSC